MSHDSIKDQFLYNLNECHTIGDWSILAIIVNYDICLNLCGQNNMSSIRLKFCVLMILEVDAVFRKLK